VLLHFVHIGDLASKAHPFTHATMVEYDDPHRAAYR
jgi:hypothetical protein